MILDALSTIDYLYYDIYYLGMRLVLVTPELSDISKSWELKSA